MENVQGISFDLWGTLIKSHPDYKRKRVETILRHIEDHHGLVGITYEEAFNRVRQFEKTVDCYSEATGYQMPVAHAFMTLIRILGATKELQESAARLEEKLVIMLYDYPPQWIDGVKDMLYQLDRHDVSTCICSNTNLVRGNDLINVLTLDKYFPRTHMVFSNDYPYCKPNRRIFFEAALRLAGSSLIHVGDNPHTDGAAILSNFKVVIVNQPNTPRIGELINHLKEKGWLHPMESKASPST